MTSAADVTRKNMKRSIKLNVKEGDIVYRLWEILSVLTKMATMILVLPLLTIRLLVYCVTEFGLEFVAVNVAGALVTFVLFGAVFFKHEPDDHSRSD